jgi:hypothetical protein
VAECGRHTLMWPFPPNRSHLEYRWSLWLASGQQKVTKAMDVTPLIGSYYVIKAGDISLSISSPHMVKLVDDTLCSFEEISFHGRGLWVTSKCWEPRATQNPGPSDRGPQEDELFQHLEWAWRQILSWSSLPLRMQPEQRTPLNHARINCKIRKGCCSSQ